MSAKVLRGTHFALVLLCCLLAIGIVLASTVYCAHAIEEGDGCDCPFCSAFSAVGVTTALILSVSLIFLSRKERHPRSTRTPRPQNPVLLAVKLNC